MCVCVFFIFLTLKPKRTKSKAIQSRRDISGSYDLSGGCPVGGEGACAFCLNTFLTVVPELKALLQTVRGKWLLRVAKTFLSQTDILAAWQAGPCRSVRSICLKFWLSGNLVWERLASSSDMFTSSSRNTTERP